MTLPNLNLSTRQSTMWITAAAITGVTLGILRWFHNRDSDRIDSELLTYPEVVTYFVENRPDDEQVKSGALLRRRHPNLWVLSFVFLNEAGAVCAGADGKSYGQRLRVRNLDEEMVELFSDKDLVVFE